MKIFIWEYLDDVTVSYHSGGGAVVVAEGLDDAIRLMKAEVGRIPKGLNGEDVRAVKPDFEADISEEHFLVEPRVFIFPDAGCC